MMNATKSRAETTAAGRVSSPSSRQAPTTTSSIGQHVADRAGERQREQLVGADRGHALLGVGAA